MNAGGQQTQVPTTSMYVQVLKEPRGLIRVLQWIFSIFAFATTSGYWSEVKLSISPICNETTIVISYPFKLDEAGSGCSGLRLTGDFSTQAEYFVCVGVLAFLYCIAILIVYFFFEPVYQSNALVPIIDLGFTLVFSVFWLTAASAWSQGVSDLKYFSDPQQILQASDLCIKGVPNTCIVKETASYATLNVSLIFGFANFALWAASLWFIYKETEWFKKRMEAQTANATT